MDRLIAAGLNELQSSMQGINTVQYNNNRRKGNYEILVEQIHMASYRCELGGHGPFWGIVTSVLKHEMDEANPQEFVDEGLRYVDKIAIDMTNVHFVRSDMMRCNR